ncbi:hypothetical protein vseg_009219 [Gypsophila vaccaria]
MTRRILDTTTTQTSTSTSSSDVSPSIMITVLILAIAVLLSASLYLLLRFLRRLRHRNDDDIHIDIVNSTVTLPHSSSVKSPRQVSPLIDTLPLFSYDNLAGKSAGDCAVCLSKFEKNDVLRLLPICCHAFHAECIDTWLSANLTCPLCRSPIIMSESDVIGKIVGGEERSGSFRVEIGNVSNRQQLGSSAVNSGEIRRSYSLGGSFDYVISAGEDAFTDVTTAATGSFRRASENFKEAEERGALAAEVGTRGGGGGWLKDYLSYSLSSSSRTASFRNSGRLFFTGSSRRSTVELPVVSRENELSELDGASRLGDEIGELFRWLSGA